MNKDLLKKQFLDIKFNELNNSFIQRKKEDFYLKNSINELNENNRINTIASLLDDMKYQLSLMIITSTLGDMSNDFSCKYICIILEKLWEQYCDNLKLKTEMGVVLIDYKNGALDVRTAYKKYNKLKEKILENDIKLMTNYKKFDELLNLNNNKQKIVALGEKFLKILEIDISILKNAKEVIDLMSSGNLRNSVKNKKEALIYFVYNSEEFKAAIMQVQHNITEININAKTR